MSTSGIVFTVVGLVLGAAALIIGFIPVDDTGVSVFARDQLERNMRAEYYSDYAINVTLPRYNAQLVAMLGVMALSAASFVVAWKTRGRAPQAPAQWQGYTSAPAQAYGPGHVPGYAPGHAPGTTPAEGYSAPNNVPN